MCQLQRLVAPHYTAQTRKYYLVFLDMTTLFPLINLHTIPHNDKAKTSFKNICKCIKNEKLKYQIYISIQTLYSVPFWSTFGSDYSLDYSWVWATSLANLYLGSFSHFSLQTFSSSVRLDGERRLVVLNFFNLRMMEATVFFGIFNAADIFWYPSPDLCLNTILSRSSTDN